MITLEHSDTNIIICQNSVELLAKTWYLVGFICIKVSKHTWSTEIKELNTTLWVLYHCQHSPTVNRAKHGKQSYSVYLSTFLLCWTVLFPYILDYKAQTPKQSNFGWFFPPFTAAKCIFILIWHEFFKKHSSSTSAPVERAKVHCVNSPLKS